ncbi:hypothetical protein D4R86_01490 [bacterium]|nr:MAG: hypothetical protein D4R86_01490 [bacterium]
MKYLHTDKQGVRTELKDLETSHLKNIMRILKRISEEGYTIKMGGGDTPDDMWYDEEEVYGEEALKYLHYYEYLHELILRQGE